MSARRCVLLFARNAGQEARRKGLAGAEALFELAAERVAGAASELGLDLLVVGGAVVGKASPRRLEQRGQGFAERLRNAFADAWALGYRQVLVVPGDVVGVAAAGFRESVAALDRGCLVLGPSPDGGVYLLGLAGVHPEVLEGVRWQTASVCDDLKARAGSQVHLLRPLADLDDRQGLARLAREQAHDPLVRGLIAALSGSLGASRRGPAEPAVRNPYLPVRSLRGPPVVA